MEWSNGIEHQGDNDESEFPQKATACMKLKSYPG